MQTAKTFYILVTTAKDGHVSTVVERRIPLSSIKSLAMSNMRDDWMVGIVINQLSAVLTYCIGDKPWSY